MIHPALGEILVSGLRSGKQILRYASSEILAIGRWKQRIEKRLDSLVHFDLAAGQQTLSGVVIRDRGDAGNAEAIDQ